MTHLGKGIRILCGFGNKAAHSQHDEKEDLYTSCANQCDVEACAIVKSMRKVRNCCRFDAQ